MSDENDDPGKRSILPIDWQKQTTLGVPTSGNVRWWERFARSDGHFGPVFRDGKLIKVSLVSDEKKNDVEPMSGERLAAIHGRLAPISAWPWSRAYQGHQVRSPKSPDGESIVADMGRENNQQRGLDAEFIAHAPEDVDALLAEVDRLRALVEALCNFTDSRITDAEVEREFDDMMRR